MPGVLLGTGVSAGTVRERERDLPYKPEEQPWSCRSRGSWEGEGQGRAGGSQQHVSEGRGTRASPGCSTGLGLLP